MNSIEQLEALKQQVIELQEKLNKLTWNDKWEPKGGEWFITSGGNIENVTTSKRCKDFGTERETEELAEKAVVKMRQFNRLLAYHDEFCPDFEFIIGRKNYFVFFDIRNSRWATNSWSLYQEITVYFTKEVAEELVEKLNSGEVEL